MRLAKASNTKGKSGAFIRCDCRALKIVLVELIHAQEKAEPGSSCHDQNIVIPWCGMLRCTDESSASVYA